MACKKIKRYLIEYIDGILDSKDAQIVEDHLSSCEICRKEIEVIKTLWIKLDDIPQEEPSPNLNKNIDNLIESFKSGVAEVGQKSSKKNFVLRRWAVVSPLTKSRIARLSVATAVVFAIIISVTLFNKYEPVATAQDILANAVKAASGHNSVYMKARMRTAPGGNFGSIGLNYEFVPIDMWKKVEQKGELRWRINKPERYIIMDGENTTLFINPNMAYKLEKTCQLGFCFDSWMGRLLDVQGLLDSELQQAQDNSDRQVRLIHELINGKDKIILEVDVQTDLAENDYLRNKFISDSDSLRVYQFDSDTKLLEDYKVYVIDKGEEILVFEITDIEYNTEIDNIVFNLDLPDDVIWFNKPQVQPDNEKYCQMTPKEAAAAFFDSASKGEWDEFLKFWPASDIDQQAKDNLAGLEVIFLGDPFQSGKDNYHWFVPYKIKDNEGGIHEGNLVLRNDNDAKRYIFDGGLQ